MNTPTAVARTEPGSASAVKAVSVISTGAVQIHPEQPYGTRKPLYWWLLTSRQWTPPLPINVYVIEHAKGLILFDTGQDRASVADENSSPAASPGYGYDRLARFDITESDTLSAQLTQLGYAPADASTAIVSHLHEDHIGGLPELAGAQLAGIGRRMGRAVQACPRIARLPGQAHPAPRPALASRQPQPGQDASLAPFTESLDVMGDGSLMLLPTPGHTAGSMSLLVRRGTRPPLLLVGDLTYGGRALLNLSDPLAVTDAAAAAEAARTAAGHLRRAGARDYLAVAISNLAQALLMLGDWDAAEAELSQATDADGLADNEFLACYRGWLAALRGDSATAQTMLAAMPDLRASEEPQDKTRTSLVEAFTAASRGQPQDALRLARGTLAHVGALGISGEHLRWAWPLAARAAHELGDTAATGELLALLDACQPGHLAPMQRAERDLVRARLAAADDPQVAAEAFADAVGSLRELSTPYHLAHGLLDHAQFLTRLHDVQAAEAAICEARDIDRNLRCQPLLDRAAHPTSATSPAQA